MSTAMACGSSPLSLRCQAGRSNCSIPRGTRSGSVATDAQGNYEFDGLRPLSFTITEVAQANWVQTQPLTPPVYSLTTQSGHNLAALNFGDHSAPSLSPRTAIDNDQAGFTATGTWCTSVGGLNGTSRIARTTSGSSATAEASWTFGGLSSGQYDVYVTYASKGNYSKAAAFCVFDGDTKKATQLIDESIRVTQSQEGLSQGSWGGVGWLELGTFSISSTTLSVKLSNKASGSFVDADGVLLVSHGASPMPARPSSGSDAGMTSVITVLGPILFGPATTTPKKSSTTLAVNRTAKAVTIAIPEVSESLSVRVVYDKPI